MRLHGKGGKERIVPVGRFAVEAVGAYLVWDGPRWRSGEPVGRDLPQPTRWTPVTAERLGCRAARGRAGRPQGTRLAPHAAPFVRDAPAGRGSGREGRAGAARPRVRDDDPDLHPGFDTPIARGLCRGSPPCSLIRSKTISERLTETRPRAQPSGVEHPVNDESHETMQDERLARPGSARVAEGAPMARSTISPARPSTCPSSPCPPVRSAPPAVRCPASPSRRR